MSLKTDDTTVSGYYISSRFSKNSEAFAGENFSNKCFFVNGCIVNAHQHINSCIDISPKSPLCTNS